MKHTSSVKRLLTITVILEYTYSIFGLLLGLTAIIGGCILCLNGVAGTTSWTAKLFILQSELWDAPAGVVLFIVGVFMIYATRPKVKFDNLHDQKEKK